jgi:hypothetical protein
MSLISFPAIDNCKNLFVAVVITFLFLCSTRAVRAQISASEQNLVFNGMQTDTLQRTFTVKGNPLPNLSFTRHDLVDAQTKVVLLSEHIAVVSTRNETAREETVRVTVTGPGKSGHYTGELEISDATPGSSVAPLKIPMDVTFRSVPAVEADVSSKSFTAKLVQPWLDLPFVGQPQGISDVNSVPAREVFLLQTGENQATVSGATVVGMKGTKDVVLPAGIVSVASKFPLNIEPGAPPVPLKIVTGGSNVASGEYNGSLQVWVTDQKAPVQIPIKLLVKDGPLFPLLVLIFGLLTAGLFGWWNAKGQGVREVIKSVDTLATSINSDGKLQLAEREEATRLLRIAMESIEAGEPVADIRKKYEAASVYVESKRTAATAFITDKLEALKADVEGTQPGAMLRTKFVTQLDELKKGVLAGKYESLDAASKLVTHPLSGLEKQVKTFQKVAAQLDAVAADKKEETRKKMDAATTMAEFGQALRDAGVDPQLDPGAAFATAGAPDAARTATSTVRLSLKRKLQLSLGAAAISIIAFIFILAVGWISIYVASDVFGANPMDYITLFLWGATAEAVRGQTISLTSLKTVAQKQGTE